MNVRGSPWLFWIVLAAPALLVAGPLAGPDADLDALTARSGEWAARLLVLVLALTPLQRLLPGSGAVAWLIRHRRAIGVAAFGHALLHLGIYLAAMGALAPIAAEALAPAMVTGWLALLLMLPLALTSNALALRRLGGRTWRRLHRLAYPAALLTLVHWLLIHDSVLAAWLTAAPLIVLQVLRIAGVSGRLSRSIP